MTDEVVLYEVRDRVAVITLNRPDHRNAWDPELEKSYPQRLTEAASSPDVRAIVVTGAGRDFCVGGENSYLEALRGTEGPELAPFTLPLKIPKLVIAAINGSCAGVGLVLALMCDLRFAVQGAKLTLSFSRLGLVAEVGSSWILPRLIGTSRALDLLISSRVVLAEEAAQMGLVNRTLPADKLLDAATAYARDVADHCSPASVGAMKAQVYQDTTRDVDTAYDEAMRLTRISLQGPDFHEGMASVLEKRPAAFARLGEGTRFV